MKKFLALILFALIFIFPSKTFAEEINSFDTTITAHKDGSMDFVEKINYDFGYLERHGIFRYIPTYAKVGDLYRIYKFSNIKVFRDGKKENFQNNSDAKQLSLKIGNADKTITGAHDYEIDYTVTNGIGSNYSDHDEIYWSSTGNGWDVDIDEASLTFNTDFGASPTRLICFTGVFGSKDSNCEVSKNSTKTSNILYSSEGLTGRSVFCRHFPKSILSKSPPATLGERVGNWLTNHYGEIWKLINIVLPIALLIWYQVHKNKKRFGPPAVSFEIPKDDGERISPAEAGAIDTGKITRDDVTATIFDLAIRKYLKLVGTKKVKILCPTRQI